MTHSNDRYRPAVQMHLQIVRRHHLELAAEDRIFIPYAYTYGYTVSEIARETGLAVPYVQRILLGA